MADRAKSERTARLEAVFWAAFLAAVVPNTVEAFADPSGDWWQVLRVGLTTLFVLAAAALLASRLADRRGG